MHATLLIEHSKDFAPRSIAVLRNHSPFRVTTRATAVVRVFHRFVITIASEI